MSGSSGIDLLKAFIARPVCKAATAPLKKGAEISVSVGGAPAVSLRKGSGGMEVTEGAPEKPDLTFKIPLRSLQALTENPSEDVGEIGIEMLKMLAPSETEARMEVKVHIGPMDLFLKGYLGVLPLGGPGVMKFLAAKGFTGLSKIREGISRFRE